MDINIDIEDFLNSVAELCENIKSDELDNYPCCITAANCTNHYRNGKLADILLDAIRRFDNPET